MRREATPARRASRRAQLPFESECVDLFASVAASLSVPKSIGQIYGLLYASPEPLGFSEIVDRLDISKGSVSQGLNLLKGLGAIIELGPNRRRNSSPDYPGTDGTVRNVKAVFEPELSLRRLVSGVLRERIAPLAVAGGGRLQNLNRLAREAGGDQRFYTERVRQLDGWRRRLRTVLPVIVALLGSKA